MTSTPVQTKTAMAEVITTQGAQSVQNIREVPKMASKPILFNQEMVRAILDDRKTQTRRLIKDKDITNNFDIDVDGSVYAYIDQVTGDSYPPTAIAKYQVGDILWVRETWCEYGNIHNPHMGYWYKASGIEQPYMDSVKFKMCKWRPSIHMPRDAARIFLKVKGVRVERLQEITEEDARAEGVNGIPRSTVLYPNDDYIYPFKQLWNSLNQKRSYGWDTNPWVWIYEFERVSEDGSSKDE